MMKHIAALKQVRTIVTILLVAYMSVQLINIFFFEDGVWFLALILGANLFIILALGIEILRRREQPSTSGSSELGVEGDRGTSVLSPVAVRIALIVTLGGAMFFVGNGILSWLVVAGLILVIISAFVDIDVRVS